jgi:AcrR family transcriptional regulator
LAEAVRSTEDRTDDPRTAGIVAFARQRKQDSRERMLAAALSLFFDRGYHDVSVDDIAKAAGVGRITFYRHFGNKADLAVELYKRLTADYMPQLRSIRDTDWRDAEVVAAWISSLFERDRSHRVLQQVFAQAVADSPAFIQPARQTIFDLIVELGVRIPAFAVDPDRPEERRNWLQAYLILFEILDQSSHAARDAGVAPDPLVIDILSERFLGFVGQRV